MEVKRKKMEEKEKKGLKNLGGETMKKRLLIMSTVMLAMLVAFSAPAAAVYDFDGYELKTMTNGTIQGDVYVGGGHGTPDLGGGSVNPENPYNQTFEVPGEAGSNGENVTWARLYVGIWGGTKYDGGWLNVTFTNNTGIATTLKNITCGGGTPPRGDLDNTPAYDPTNSSYNTGCGVWLVALNCTSNVTSGTNTVNATTGGPWVPDGRVYAIVLVTVYENSSSAKVQYWVNEGNVNLHYHVFIYGSDHPELNNNVTWFNGTAYNCTEANLTTVYYGSTQVQPDYLYFNAPYASDSPYNLSNDRWNIDGYRRYQLDSNDVANEYSDNCSVGYSDTHCDCSGAGCCGCSCDCSKSKQYFTYGFDFDCFSKTNDSTPLCDIINHTANNYAIFWRGWDTNNNGEIDYDAWNQSDEGETYVHPIVAVLVLKNITHVYDFSDNFSGTPGEDAWAFRYQVDAKPPTNNGVPNTEFSSTEYGYIKTDNGVYQPDESDCDGNYAAHRFNFSIDETAPEKINVTWNGKGWHDNGTSYNGTQLYIWNGTAYEELDNTTSGADVTLTGVNKSAATTYINGGNVTVLVVQKSADHTGEDDPERSHIATDYVRLEVTPDP
ncbi:MAG: DUF3344 domain-containing protein [Halobacteriota archaeon]